MLCRLNASSGGIVVPREDGTSSIKGHTVFVSQNGRASYSFEDIANNENNSTIRLGAAFFDANATGDLGFLKSKVGVYESHVDNGNRQGIFAMMVPEVIHIKDQTDNAEKIQYNKNQNLLVSIKICHSFETSYRNVIIMST